MKKLGKFIFGTLSIATLAAGAYYLYKNYIKKDTSDDLDDFDDDYEDFDADEESTDNKNSRGYVSINITSSVEEKEDSKSEEDVDSKTEETKETPADKEKKAENEEL